MKASLALMAQGVIHFASRAIAGVRNREADAERGKRSHRR
jgi:hypothetical protein